MDYFADVLTTFLDLAVALLSREGQRALRFYTKCLNLCSEGKRRSYRFVTT